MTELIVDGVHKWLGGLQVLKGASFSAERGKIVALLGASGSGKTTLLRCIAGLEQPELGTITIGENSVFDHRSGIALAPEQRNIGLVFQSYALWPHRTVQENVGYGLKLRGVAGAEAGRKVQDVLKSMGISDLAGRYPHQLSGGQQQRVAICRAMVYEPRVLLLDEPLSNLDAKLREEARYWIRRLIHDREICAIIVTHDQTEALAAADHILLLKDGQILQQGTPRDIYSNPSDFYVADFLGSNVVASGTVRSPDGDRATIAGEGWSLVGVPKGPRPLESGNSARAVIRVEHIGVSDTPGANAIEMQIEDSLFLGASWEYRMRRGDLTLKALGSKPLPVGSVWCCSIPEQSVWLFSL